MKIGFITDSTCDLPAPILRKHNVHVLPIKVLCEHRIVHDDKKVNSYKRVIGFLKRELECESTPFEVNEIKDYFVNLLTNFDYDYLICLMPMKSRSESYNRTLDASIAARKDIRILRTEKGWEPTVEIEVIDSSQISTGLGLVLLNTIKSYEKDHDYKHLIEIVNQLKKQTQTYVLPNNLEYLYKKGTRKGDESVGLGSYLIGTALDIKPIILVYENHSEAIARIKGFDNAINNLLEMLMTHIHYKTIVGDTINISFGNTLKILKQYPKFLEFEKLAKSHGITVLLSNMSATLNVNVGLNSFTVAFLSNKIVKNF